MTEDKLISDIYAHKQGQSFDYQLYLATLRTADAAEIPMVNKDNLARAMAIVYADQGGNEQITHSYKLMAEMQFAQEKYHIMGGERPDPKFIQLVKRYIREIEIFQEQEAKDVSKVCDRKDFPDWAVTLMMGRYGVKID